MCLDVLDKDEAILSKQWVIDDWSFTTLSHCTGEYTCLPSHYISSLSAPCKKKEEV